MLSSNLFFFHLGGYYQKGEIETNVNNFFCVLRTPSQVPQLPKASGLEIGMATRLRNMRRSDICVTYAPNIPTYVEYAVHANDAHRQMYPHGQP